jgi:tetratricopeptide (TPR) repeat protein
VEWLLRSWLGLIAAVAILGTAAAEEPAREFLEKLRERGYYDIAVEYLDNIQNNPLVPPSFREVVLYEKGLTLVESSRRQRDMAVREKQLDQAQQMFKQFIETRQTNPLVTAANSQLGNLVVERARMKVEEAKATSDMAKKQALLDAAKPMYEQATKLFTDLQEQVKVKLEAIPKVLPLGDPRIPIRDQLRADYLQAQLLKAAVTEESADTVAEGSPEYTKRIQEAAALYKKIFEDYRTRLAGLYARLYQGRCHWKIKDNKNALSFFTDLLEQPDQPEEFRLLKKKTLIYAVEILLDENEPKYVEAIKRLETLVDSLNQFEKVDIEWLKLQMALVKAYKYKMEDIGPGSPDYTISLNRGRNLVRFLMRTPSDFQAEAQQLAPFFEVRVIDVGSEGPQTFQEAMEAGKEQLALMQSAPASVQKLTDDLKGVTDPARKEELQKQLDEAQQQAQTSPDKAMEFFRLALELADLETPVADINLAQYYITYLHYIRGELWRAAVVGDFVARKYPNSAGARQCAKIAMAAYLTMYRNEQDPTFETEQSIAICEHILKQWPDQPEAVDAANTLIALLLKDDKVEDAVRYIEETIPEDASYRGIAELKTGQAIWNGYINGMNAARQIEDEAERDAAKAKLEPNKIQAEKILANGVARMRETGNVDQTFADALLSLVQVYVDVGKPELAIKECEDPKVGVLTLIRAKHPTTAKEGYAVAAYTAALRGYVSTLATSSEPDKSIAKAKQIMAELKTAMGGGADGEQRLVQTYLGMAKELKDQIQNADDAARKPLTEGFETFLRQVGAESSELNVLNMVSESFYSLAEGLDTNPPGSPIPAEAKLYYEEAAKSFQTILDKGEADKSWLPDKMRSQVRFRLATARRKLGNYKDAITAYKEILEENAMMLNVQVEAAHAYREWADSIKEGKMLLYERSMRGNYPDTRPKIDGKENKSFNQNVIWGWGKIAQITQRYPEFRDTFHEARFNLALSRMRYALQRDKKDDVTKYLKMAKSDIEMTHRLYPELGGDEWRRKYDNLLKEIQRALGEPPLGLAEFAKAAAAP